MQGVFGIARTQGFGPKPGLAQCRYRAAGLRRFHAEDDDASLADASADVGLHGHAEGLRGRFAAGG